MKPSLKKRNLSDLFKGIDNIKPTIIKYEMINGDMPVKELSILCQVVQFVKPQTIFEIGTFLGTTTLHLAASGKAQIYTLDLPVDSQKRRITDPELDVFPVIPGQRFMNSDFKVRIKQIYGDSTIFDFSPWHGKMDLVFVDACHHYENVSKDSENALKMVFPKGVVIWHDYADYAPGVVQALNELSEELNIINITGTSLAILLN
jgi:predicted O-methyltransferase YrrM